MQLQRCLQLADCDLVPKSTSALNANHSLDTPSPSECLLTQLEFIRPIDQLPIQSYVCVLGALLALLDLDELASRPSTNESVIWLDTNVTDELVIPPDTNDLSLVMHVGQRLLNLVDRYVISSVISDCDLLMINKTASK